MRLLLSEDKEKFLKEQRDSGNQLLRSYLSFVVYADIDYETLWNLSLPELKILSELHAEKVEAMSGKKNKEFKQQAI